MLVTPKETIKTGWIFLKTMLSVIIKINMFKFIEKAFVWKLFHISKIESVRFAINVLVML